MSKIRIRSHRWSICCCLSLHSSYLLLRNSASLLRSLLLTSLRDSSKSCWTFWSRSNFTLYDRSSITAYVKGCKLTGSSWPDMPYRDSDSDESCYIEEWKRTKLMKRKMQVNCSHSTSCGNGNHNLTHNGKPLWLTVRQSLGEPNHGDWFHP